MTAPDGTRYVRTTLTPLGLDDLRTPTMLDVGPTWLLLTASRLNPPLPFS